MANLSDRKTNDRFHGMIYGASGSGKTELLGTFPDPYILDTDFGLETLFGKDVDYDECYVRLGDPNAKEMWPTILEKTETFAKSPTNETFAVDSLTTIMDVATVHILAKAGRSSLLIQDYTPIYDEVTKLIVRLRRMPCNMVLTAHEEMIRDEMTGKTQVIPLVMGNKFGPKLPIFFTNIYNVMLDIPKGGNAAASRTLLVQSDGIRMAKTQSKSNQTRIEKSYDAIMQHIQITQSEKK